MVARRAHRLLWESNYRRRNADAIVRIKISVPLAATRDTRMA